MRPLYRIALVTAALTAPFAPAHALTVGLGLAGQFNVVTFGNFTGFNGDTEGLLAVGGDARLGAWAVNADKTPAYAGYSLISGGDFTATGTGKVHGDSFIGGSSSGSFTLGTVSTGPSPLDFGALHASLTTLSDQLALAASTGNIAYQWGGGWLSGTGADVEVFNLDGAQLSTANYFNVTGGIKSGATVIVNISGTSVSLLNSFENLGSNVLLNFYEASAVSLTGAIGGSVLATEANVTGYSGHVVGTLVADSYASVKWGGFEFHDATFTPTEVPVSLPVPEPGTWALMLAGLLLVPAVARRARG